MPFIENIFERFVDIYNVYPAIYLQLFLLFSSLIILRDKIFYNEQIL